MYYSKSIIVAEKQETVTMNMFFRDIKTALRQSAAVIVYEIEKGRP